jgi:hypothetical protein
MALSAAVVWEVRTTGNDNNGGGFNTSASGTDRSQQTTAQVDIDGSTISATVFTTTTQITLVGYTVVSADVGNLLRVNSGTATAGVYEITAIDAVNNRWTLDRSAGTSTQTVVGKMGGAVASLGRIAGVAVDRNVVYVKAGTYAISTTSSNVSNGIFTLSGAGVTCIGYNSNRTRTNTDTRPLFQMSVGATLATGNSNGGCMVNFDLDGGNVASSKASGGALMFERCSFTGFKTASASTGFLMCTATGNSAAVFTGVATLCEAYGNTATPFVGIFTNCLSYDNTGASTDGFAFVTSTSASFAWGCVAYGNGRDGFSYQDDTRFFSIQNCVAVNNGRYGFNVNATGGTTLQNHSLFNCAGYNNTSGNNLGNALNSGYVTLAGDPFVNAPSPNSNYALNNTAGAGAALRAAGYAALPRGLTTGYLDIGVAQHQDSGSSSVIPRIMHVRGGSIYGG